MSLKSDLDALLSAAIAAGDVAGVSVQVRIGRDAPMQPDTVRIASMSKPITATAVMQLVEQGRLDLDAPAAAVLPELADAVVLTGFGPDGRPRTRPAAGPITTRQLLTHTSGFAYEFWSRDRSLPRHGQRRHAGAVGDTGTAGLRPRHGLGVP